jgi:SAM-dependent methyltransferase
MDARLQVRIQRYGWDKASSVYEDGWALQLRPAHQVLLDLACLRAGERLVDVASGTGLVSFEAARKVGPDGHVFGTDLSEEMVRRARELAKWRGIDNVTFERMNAMRLTLLDGKLDAALCALGLMYVPDAERALAEMARVIRPGGQVAVAVWGERRRCGWAPIFEIVDRRVRSEVCPLFFRLGMGEALSRAMTEAGLGDVTLLRVETELAYDSAEEALLAAFDAGPVALAYARFDEATRADVHREYLDAIAPFRAGEGYRIPGEFVIASGRKPAS